MDDRFRRRRLLVLRRGLHDSTTQAMIVGGLVEEFHATPRSAALLHNKSTWLGCVVVLS